MSAAMPPWPDLPPPPGDGAWIDPDARPTATWTWYAAIGVYLLAFVIAGFVSLPVLLVMGRSLSGSGATGASGPPDIVSSIAADIAITAILVFWLRRWHPTWVRIIGFPPRSRLWREFGYGLVAGLVLYPLVAFIVGAVLTALFRAAFGQDITAPEQLAQHLGVLGSVAAVVLAVVVAPVSEELFFRGILFRSLRDRYGFWPGALASAVTFGLAHYVPSPWRDALLLQTIMVFTGVGLAWIYERRGNLVANIGAHMLFNTIGILLILTVH